MLDFHKMRFECCEMLSYFLSNRKIRIKNKEGLRKAAKEVDVKVKHFTQKKAMWHTF